MKVFSVGFERALSLGAVAVLAGTAGAESTPPDLSRAAETALSAAVSVAFQPQVAGLEEPIVKVVDEERCPNCGSRHSSDLSSLVKMETSAFCTGFLIAPDRVVCLDQQLALENIAAISVSAGSHAVSATVEKRFVGQNALLLKLDRPLPMGRAAGIAKEAGPPVCAVTVARRARDPRLLQASPAPLQARTVYGDQGVSWAAVSPPAALLDSQNRICGYTFEPEWRTNDLPDPARWPAYSPAEIERRAAEATRTCVRSVLPVTLSYRSPRMSRSGDSRLHRRLNRATQDESETETELNTLGVLVSDRRLVIRIGEGKEKLVRLERIKVFFADGPVEAAFVCALASVQGIVAELPQPRPEQVLRVARVPDGGRQGLSFLTQVDVSGPGCLRARTTPIRVPAVTFGWRNTDTTDLPVDKKGNLFVFSAEGACLWWNAAIDAGDDSIGEARGHWRGGSESQVLPASVLAGLANPGARDIDAAVHPASPEDENRLGWLGLDLQPITRELAESKNIVADTGGGTFGALVTRVYPDSPAAQAGVKEGWVLLSVNQADRALPLKVQLEDTESMYRSEFPWDRLDEVPPEYMDQLPTPWPSASNPFVVGLTQLGVGAKVVTTFIADGVKTVKPMAIALAPPTYESAPSYKWKAGGISVCDLTYEARDYLGLAKDAPGVIVCHLESGGKAVTAGMRPYEVITRLNGKPVPSAKAFEALSGGVTEVRLDVKRMTRDRVVSFSVTPAKEGPTLTR